MYPHKLTASQLETILELPVSPIAISFCETIPEDIPAFENTVPAGCAFWEKGAEGVFATSTEDHELCAIGVYTHHMAEPSKTHPQELQDALQAMTGLGYVREEEVAQIPVLNRVPNKIVYGPLAELPVDPDIVLLFAKAQQGLIISEAVQRIDTCVPPAMGRPACAVIPQVMNTGVAAMSLGCCGARAYLEAMTDDIALWALPGAQIQRYADEIAILSKANQTLQVFHRRRKKDIALGEKPSVQISLSRAFS
ncbi:MAG: DUF169 domain-containing protein [Nitrospiria bacterium]